MGRLTEKDVCGNWGLRGLPWKNLYTGTPITWETYEVLYGALRKLKDYEDTGLSPAEAKELHRIKETEEQWMSFVHTWKLPDANARKWILVEERLPEPGQRVIATLKHHKWILDYDSDWIPPEEKIEYPEYTETKEVLYRSENHWEYEDDECIMTAYTNPKEDISFPVVQVIAWQEFPEPYQYERV